MTAPGPRYNWVKAAFGFNYDITSAVQAAVQDIATQFSHRYCTDKQYLEKAPFNWEACVQRSSLISVKVGDNLFQQPFIKKNQ